MINIDKLSEGVDYELIPSTESTNDQAWWIRFLRGPFVETVVQFGNVRVNGKQEQIHFNFSIIESPIDNINSEDPELQDWCGSVLHDVLDKHIANDAVEMKEVSE